MEKRKKGRKPNKRLWKIMASINVMLLGGFTACGRQQMPPNIPLQDLIVEYPLENMSCFVAAKDGTVYQINLEMEMEMEESGYKLHRFNAQGELEKYINLTDYVMVETLAVSEDGKNLYFTGQDDLGLGIFSCNLENGTITKLCELDFFDRVKQMVMIGDKLYILGLSPNWQSNTPPSSGYSFGGERLVSYSVATGEATQLGFDFPISMAVDDSGKLMVSGYLDKNYCLMEYDPLKDSMQVRSNLQEYKFDRFAVCNNSEDVVYDYTTNSRGLVLSDIDNLAVEAELYPDTFTMRAGVLYAGGRIYCPNRLGNLVSFPLDAVQRDNKVLSFLTREYGTLTAPYGCGYQMEKIELSQEKFTVKVLARDGDYDLCMGESFDGDASNLRENGVFYPLNDLPGIEEYFARCFPYVREAATKEDGTIWMLPIQIKVASILSKEGVLKENEISLHQNMTWEEYAQMLLKMTEEQRSRISISSGFLQRIFARQYFSHYHTFEGGLFEPAAYALSQIYNIRCGQKATPEDTIMQSVMGLEALNYFPGRTYYEEDGVFVGMPKFSASDKNIASCIFLAVNPDSKKRDEALAYLADLIAYQMKLEDVPYFSDKKEENALNNALYEVYENAEVVFAVDSDIYDAGFEEMLSGKLSVSEYIKQTESKLKIYWGE
jgi:hypothetical protein